MIGQENGIEIQIPIRAVMNNNTFSAFSGFKFEDLRKTFDLPKTKITQSVSHEHCFVLQQSDKKKATFCDFGLESTPNFYNEWTYDFNLFKYQCAGRRDTMNLTLAEDLNNQIGKIKVRKKVDFLARNKS